MQTILSSTKLIEKDDFYKFIRVGLKDGLVTSEGEYTIDTYVLNSTSQIQKCHSAETKGTTVEIPTE